MFIGFMLKSKSNDDDIVYSFVIGKSNDSDWFNFLFLFWDFLSFCFLYFVFIASDSNAEIYTVRSQLIREET